MYYFAGLCLSYVFPKLIFDYECMYKQTKAGVNFKGKHNTFERNTLYEI